MVEPEHESAVREVYDATVDAYVAAIGTVVADTIEGPLDRALLAAFVELVSGVGGRVADLGCGPGRVGALLAAGGIDVVGVDLSPAMVAAARTAHPGIQFEVGSLSDLPIADGSLVGAVCWYSIIHTPPGGLDQVFREVARVVVDGGHLLVAFQAGDGETVRRPDAYGSGRALTSHRHAPDDVALRLAAAGFRVTARTVREPELDHESAPQAFLLARRDGPAIDP